MKILRKSVYSHYLKKYKQASKMLKAAYINYNKLVGSFIETLNLCNCGNNSYWGNNPEKFFENQAALYKTKEQLKHYRKALAYSVSLAKSLLKQRQREFTFAESNLHKAIKINGGISKRTAYDLLNTADIEKENYYKLESLTRYSSEGAIGFNPTVLKKQNECMKHELIMLNRNYIAISLKHSTKDCIMYWGTRTQDNESRCFSGYTANFSNCELYSPGEFYSNYGKKNYPIVDKCSSYSKLRKDYKDRDTVLVKVSDWNKIIEETDRKARYNRAKKGANILSKGDKVVMHTCAEAHHYDGKIWECASDSWDNYGTELVMLKDFSGGFCTEFLQRVNV